MIKINLLPKYLNEKKIVRNLALLYVFIIVATAVGGFVYKTHLDNKTAEMAQNATIAEAEKARIKGINDAATAEMAKIAPIAAKLKFFQDLAVYNTQLPNLYQELAKYTYKGVLYRKVAPSATGLQIDAYTPSLSDLGRYLLNMYRADSIFSSVSISAIPGYPAAQGVSVVQGGGYPMGPMAYPGMSQNATRYGGLGAVASGVSKTVKETGFNFTVACTLKAPIAPPAPPAGGSAAAPTTPGMAPPQMAPMAPVAPVPGSANQAVPG